MSMRRHLGLGAIQTDEHTDKETDGGWTLLLLQLLLLTSTALLLTRKVAETAKDADRAL